MFFVFKQKTAYEVRISDWSSYVCSSDLLAALETGGVKALAHITGGGFPENLPRVFPKSLGVVLPGIAWPVPAVFGWLASTGGIAPEEMLRTFNCGIGMAVVADPAHAAAVRAAFEIGRAHV